MDIVEPAYLRKEAPIGLVVPLPEGDSASPVVSPLNHGARLKTTIYYFREERSYLTASLTFRQVT